MVLVLILLNSCKKDNNNDDNTTTATLPEISIGSIVGVLTYSVWGSAQIHSDGGSAITACGLCWSANQNPTIADNKTNEDPGVTTFISEITGLTPLTYYYVRAYATNSAGTAYSYLQVKFASGVGLSYQGGIVANILEKYDNGYDENVVHGLIVAPSDQSSGMSWDNGTHFLIGVTATEKGTGNSNTNAIVTVQGSGNYAAKLCYDLVLGGYSDWYLPSKDELYLLNSYSSNIGSFNGGRYWSSSETYLNNAWLTDFSYHDNLSYPKGGELHVRAIRSF